MEKQEYFNALLKRDFIRYVLLKAPQRTDEAVVTILKSRIDVDQLYQDMKKHLPVVIEKHLSPIKFKNDAGEVVDELPEGFHPGVADEICAEYRALIQQLYRAETLIDDVVASGDLMVWSQGVDSLSSGLRKFVEYLRTRGEHYRNVGRSTPDFYDVKSKYEAACRQTLREQLMRDNDKDVTSFLEAMTSYSRDLCTAELSLRLSEIYFDLASSKEMNDIINRAEALHDLARQELAALNLIPAVDVWDKEYEELLSSRLLATATDEEGLGAAFSSVVSRIVLTHRRNCIRQFETILTHDSAPLLKLLIQS